MPKTFKAHYNGAHIIADETVDLVAGTPLLVTVLEPSKEAWHDKWHQAVAEAGDEVEFQSHDAADESQTVQAWRLITHHADRDRALRWSLGQGRLAIGWGRIGDLRSGNFGSQAEVAAAIVRAYQSGHHPLNNSKAGGFSLWNGWKHMKIGDLVILRGGSFSRVVKVTGDYFFDARNTPLEDDFYNHQRPVEATAINPDALWQRAGRMASDGGSIYRTLIRCARQVSPADL